MTQISNIVLWVAGFFGGLVALLIAISLGRTVYARLVTRRFDRRVDHVEALIKQHQDEHFVAIDHLLVDLGAISDATAVENAINARLAAAGSDDVEHFAKLYASLGITARYVERLRSAPQWNERAAAAHILGRIRAVEAIPRLVETLRDPDEDERGVKLAAAEALSEMSSEDAIPLLLEQLKNPDEWASPRVADILVTMGAPVVGPLIEVLTNDRDTNARVWAAQILGRIEDPGAIQKLLPHLRDRSQNVRMAIANALGRHRDPAAINELVGVAMRDPVASVRAEAAKALGTSGDESVVQSLVSLLDDPDYWTRLRAVEAIEAIRPDDASPLCIALRDPSRDVRKRAAVALERIGYVRHCVEDLRSDDRSAIDHAIYTLIELGRAGLTESIIAFLEHDDFRVRARVAEALGESEQVSAATPLATLLRDPFWPTRARAVEAIERLHPDDGVQLLLPALSDDEETVRAAAAGAIRTLGVPDDPEVLRSLLEQYHTENSMVRCAVIGAAGHLDVPEVDEILETGIADPNPDVRMAAMAAVGERRAERWIEPLSVALGDPNVTARTAAATALGKMSNDAVVEILMQHIDTPDRAFRDAITEALARHGVDTISALAHASESVENTLALVWTLGKTLDNAAIPHLEKLAHHPEAQVRAAVAGALARFEGDPAVVDALIALLHDRNERTRAAAANAIGKIGAQAAQAAQAALPHLRAALQDPDPFVRRRVAITLGLIGGNDAVDMLMPLITHSRDAKLKIYAVVGAALAGRISVAISALADPEIKTGVEQLIAREAPDVRERFGRALLVDLRLTQTSQDWLSTADLAKQYFNVLKSNQDAGNRAAAVEALRALGPTLSREPLMDAVRTDPNPNVRRLALEALASSGDVTEVGDVLADALADPTLAVQLGAARAITRCSTPMHNALLLACFRKRDAELNTAVSDALVAANRETRAIFIDELMGFDDEIILCGGAGVLGRLGDPAAVPLLSGWLSSRSPLLRAACVRALGNIGTVDAKATAVGSLGDPHPSVRVAALEALSNMLSPDLIDELRPLTGDPASEVRVALAILVGASGVAGMADVAATLCGDPSDDVRVEALLNLLCLGDAGTFKEFLEQIPRQSETVQNHVIERAPQHPAWAAVLQVLTSARDAGTREAAVRVLGALARKPVAELRTALQDPAATVRVAAIAAIVETHDPEAKALLEKLVDDPSPAVRDAFRRQHLRLVATEK